MTVARSLVASSLTVLLVGSACQSPEPGDLPADAPAGEDPAAAAWPQVLVSGRGTLTVRVGDTLAQARRWLGAPSCAPDPSCATPQGFALVSFGQSGLSALLGSAGPRLDDSAVVLALWSADGKVRGPARLGMTRAEVERSLGAPDQVVGPVLSYGRGLALTLGPDGKVATQAVFAPYSSQKAPPEMTAAGAPPSASGPALRWPRYQLDGEEIDVVDMHLHPGSFGALGAGLSRSLAATVPPFLLPLLPAFVNGTADPYAPGVGMVAQAQRHGFSHLVYYAVWAPDTVGWWSNSELSRLLYDARNGRRPDGRPLAYGFASIRWDHLDDDALTARRCDALESYLQRQGERMIGIKLAHPHQRVPLASSATDCVYALAARHHKPVALHTGKTPTEGSLDTPEAYDPRFLEEKIKAFPGASFVLLHVGQGDRRATLSALDLAQRYGNVSLELSALGRPAVLNERGEMEVGMEPQFPFVLAEVKRRGLVDRTLWGSDGPQSPGFVAVYRDKLVAEMKSQGYSKEQIKAVLAGNFYRVFHL